MNARSNGAPAGSARIVSSASPRRTWIFEPCGERSKNERATRVASGSMSHVMSSPPSGSASAMLSAEKPVNVPISSTRRAPMIAQSVFSSVPSMRPTCMCGEAIVAYVTSRNSSKSAGLGLVWSCAYCSISFVMMFISGSSRGDNLMPRGPGSLGYSSPASAAARSRPAQPMLSQAPTVKLVFRPFAWLPAISLQQSASRSTRVRRLSPIAFRLRTDG